MDAAIHAGALDERRGSRFAADPPLVVHLERSACDPLWTGHQLVTTLRDYLAPTDRVLVDINDRWDKDEPFDYDDAQLQERASSYWHAYEAFVDVAEAAVGSRLA